MRPSVLLLLLVAGLLCLGTAAQAQQQESRIDQILNPDPTRRFDLRNAKSYGIRNYKGQSGKVVETKSATLPDKFRAKEYLTGAFHSQKSFWQGDFKYSVNEANTKSRFLFLLPGKSYTTQAVPTKAFPDKGKYRDASATSPTRDFRGKERDKMNKHLTPEQATNNGYRGDLHELKSIDDVRALLNKSK